MLIPVGLGQKIGWISDIVGLFIVIPLFIWDWIGKKTMRGSEQKKELAEESRYSQRMARPWRIEYEGTLYHVLSRGNERREIFLDDSDRNLFLQTL